VRRTKKSRRASLGGSDAGAVVGLNEYQSAFDAWWAKVGDSEDKFTENKYTYWGTIKEKVVAEHYAARHGIELIESPKRVWDVRPWMTGTPDRLLVSPENFNERDDLSYLGTYSDPVSGKELVRRGLEIKTALEKHTTKWHTYGSVSIGDRPPYVVPDYRTALHSVPMYYWFQCQWYMALMGFEEWDLCVLLGSSDYREYRLYYDREYMTEAIERCEFFWTHHVENNVPPPIDWGKMVNTYLEKKYGPHSDILREGTSIDDTMALALRDKGRRMKELIEEEKELKTKLARMEGVHRSLKADLTNLKKENDALCNWFRERIGKDLGVETQYGTVKWSKSGDRARTLRKTWKRDD